MCDNRNLDHSLVIGDRATKNHRQSCKNRKNFPQSHDKDYHITPYFLLAMAHKLYLSI